jgi:hypothetical protein
VTLAPTRHRPALDEETAVSQPVIVGFDDSENADVFALHVWDDPSLLYVVAS